MYKINTNSRYYNSGSVAYPYLIFFWRGDENYFLTNLIRKWFIEHFI